MNYLTSSKEWETPLILTSGMFWVNLKYEQ